ncbi:hypothetical protein K440DRAFT_613972 [Wilcoxina mikolae CBS 423.85]|nr:hypothetical protein K440DRAFT_613972 [Wilcoxina mikolae CBS 423.85]
MTSRTYRVIKQTQTSAFSTSARFVNATANSACKMLVDPRKTQTASIKLHEILCNTQPSFRCSCHLLHLCLDIKNEKPQPKNLKGTPGTVKLETEFLFLMTTTSKPGSKSASQSMMQLVFTSKEIESASAELNSISKTCDTLCEELLASNEEYERYLWSPGHNQDNSGFVLRRTLPPESLANINSMVSLDHLISTTEIDQLDRYQIAASLASSVLSFYSSPWVRDLTLETIQFLDKAAESTSLWTPHIPVKFSSDNHQFGTRNREIYALGLILLQLGQGRRLCSTNGEAEEERVLLKNALRDASRKVGRRYKQVVENCLFKWSDMNLDLMEEGHAAAFRTDIEVLERLVADF